MKKYFFLFLVLIAYWKRDYSQCTPINSTYSISDRTVTAGNSTSFSVSATGTSISYQWQYSTNGGSVWNNATGSPFSGASTSVLTVNPATAGMSGYKFRCFLMNDCTNIAYTNWANLTVTSACTPINSTYAISDKTVTDGNSVSFNVGASGTSISYQWQYSSDGGSTWTNANGGTFNGGTTSTLTINPATSGMTGYKFRCSLENSCTSIAFTNWASLTVNPACTPITSTYSVSDETVMEGASISFSVSATGTSISYQWQYSSDNGSTWNDASVAPFSGETTSTLTLNPAAFSMNNYRIRCLLVNSCSPLTATNWAKLTVTSTCTPITSTYVVADQTVNDGGSVYFSIEATGTLISYQWQYSSDNGSTWSIAAGNSFSGENTPTLTINPAYASMNNYKLRCLLVNGCTPVTGTNWANLTVLSNCDKIVSNMFISDKTAINGGNVNFNISAKGTAISYQWQYSIDGGISWNNAILSPFSGGTTSTLTISSVPSSMNGYKFRCSLFNNCTPLAYSNWANLTIVANLCTPATVVTVFNGIKSINTTQLNLNNYLLYDNCQNANMHVQDWNSISAISNPVEISSATNTWTSQNQQFGGSVLWAIKQAYNYFSDIHARPSYDGLNGDVSSFINVVFKDCGSCKEYTDQANMSFTGGIMNVGLGSSGTLNNSYCALDIIAHEYTHAVTGSSSELIYQNESGALNESFSDIFGEVIENYVLGHNDWLIGSERANGAIRSMSSPKFFNQPNTYLSENDQGHWYTGTGDFGGVHINSGVQNYWFYLLSEGGSGTNDNGVSYNVTGIGITKASQIAFRNLTIILKDKPGAIYEDAQIGSIQAAEEIFGTNSPEVNAVKEAWCAVGVGTCNACFTPATITVDGSGAYCSKVNLHANGGEGGKIYWQGTTSGGTSAAVESSSQVVEASGTYFFRAMSDCGVWGPEGSATVTIDPTTNTWTGSVSTAWEEPANWSCGSIPDETTNVIIESGNVVVNSNAICKSLNIKPGMDLKVNTGFNLTIVH